MDFQIQDVPAAHLEIGVLRSHETSLIGEVFKKLGNAKNRLKDLESKDHIAKIIELVQSGEYQRAYGRINQKASKIMAEAAVVLTRLMEVSSEIESRSVPTTQMEPIGVDGAGMEIMTKSRALTPRQSNLSFA